VRAAIALTLVATISPWQALAADSSSSSSSPSTLPAEPTTPRGALKALAVAMNAGDANAIHRLLLTRSDTEQRMVDLMSDMAVAIAELNRAMVARFGRTQAAAVLGGDPDQTLARSLGDLDHAAERIQGNTAVVVGTPGGGGAGGPAGQDSFTLKKGDDGVWRVAVSTMSNQTTPQQVEEKAAVLGVQMRAMREVTTAIAAGKYATAEEAAAALHSKMGGPPPATEPTSSAPAR
jgi:hypothetical protein